MSTNVARKKRRKKRRRGKKLLVFTIVMAVLATVLYALSISVFFNIKSVEIAGSSRYDAVRIIEASGVEVGDNLIRMNPASVSDTVCKALPYIGVAKVERKFPDKVRITVEECAPDIAYEYENEYILAYGDKCLELVDEKPEGLVTVKAELDGYTVGFPMTIPSGTKESLSQLIKATSNAGIDGITYIDVQNVSELTVVCDNLLKLKIGTTDSLEKKMNNAVSIIETQRQKYGNNVEGTIDLRYLSDESNLSYFTRESISEAPIETTESVPSSSQISSVSSSSVNSN